MATTKLAAAIKPRTLPVGPARTPLSQPLPSFQPWAWPRHSPQAPRFCSQLFCGTQGDLGVQGSENLIVLASLEARGYPSQLWLFHISDYVSLPLEWCPSALLQPTPALVVEWGKCSPTFHVLPSREVAMRSSWVAVGPTTLQYI